MSARWLPCEQMENRAARPGWAAAILAAPAYHRGVRMQVVMAIAVDCLATGAPAA
jgi:hypothetical protein